MLSAYVELVFDNSDGRFPVRSGAVRCGMQRPACRMPRGPAAMRTARLHPHHAPRHWHAACVCALTLRTWRAPPRRRTGCGTAQIDKDEVRLRRSIGAKKDEYTLDRKHVT